MQVRLVDGAATRELRRAVLRPAWPLGSPMHGDENADAVHLAVVDDEERVVGACLVLPRDYPLRPALDGAWQLRGMATAAEVRSQGIGTRLLAAAIDEIRRQGGRLVWCDARTSAVGFYRLQGFAAEGAEFEHHESGIPHFRMWRDLAH